MPDGGDFDLWIRAVSPESFESGAFIEGHWLNWLHSTFDRLGPIDRSQLEVESRAAVESVLAEAPWSRIVRDFASTTGRNLALNAEFDESNTWLNIGAALDGRLIGSFSASESPDEEVLVVDLADRLREFALDEEVWGGWPICPTHRTHPLEAALDRDGRAAWLCPNGADGFRIGDL